MLLRGTNSIKKVKNMDKLRAPLCNHVETCLFDFKRAVFSQKPDRKPSLMNKLERNLSSKQIAGCCVSEQCQQYCRMTQANSLSSARAELNSFKLKILDARLNEQVSD